MKIKNIIPFFIVKIFFLIFLANNAACSESNNWLQEEYREKHEILYAFWINRIVKYNQTSVDNFKSILINYHFPKDSVFEVNINKIFQDAIRQKINFELFYQSLKDQPLVFFRIMNGAEKLYPQKMYQEIKDPVVSQTDLTSIQQYIKNKNLSVSITLGSAKSQLITPNYLENQYQYPFAIHSIGKLFSSMLLFMMIEQGVISEQDLQNPVQLDNTVLKKLPVTVREQLKKVTLYQLMIHQGGLGDYLPQYVKAIESGHAPVIKHVEDFLPFVDKEVYPVGIERYSNAGFLIVGLAIKHAYEKKYKHPINYNILLKGMLVDPIGMSSFSIIKPDNAKYNLQDPIAPYIAGSPAGGYWLTSNDLGKFGQWIYQKATYDSIFRNLIHKYGQEFFHVEDDTVAHGGGIQSSNAFLSVSLKTGAVLAIESNQPPGFADDLKTMIQDHIYAKELNS